MINIGLVKNLIDQVRAIAAAGIGALVATTINGMTVETGTLAGSNPASVTYVRVGSFYIGFGSSAPVSVDLPVNSFYVNALTGPSHVYVKWGAAAGNWTGVLSSGSSGGSLSGVTISTLPLAVNAGMSRGGVLSVNVTGTETDWNPFPSSNIGGYSVIIATPDAARTINSMLDSGSHQDFLLVNGSSTAGRNLTLTHDDGATGTAAKRFLCPANTSLVVPANGCARIWRDVSGSRWRAMRLY